jgi:tetratricopeptide (TPR) repeat protein
MRPQRASPTCPCSLQESSTMLPRLRDHLVIASAMTLFTLPLLAVPQLAEAQDGGRARVMIPNLEPTDDTRDRFGQRVANNLRNGIDFDRFVGMSERDMDRLARDYDMRARDLNCAFARQLASLVSVPLVMCGYYEREGEELRVSASFFTVPGNEEFPVEPFLIPERDERQAADIIVERFDRLAQQMAAVDFCLSDYASSNFEGALNYCSQAVELAPDVLSPKVALAGSYMELNDFENALRWFENVLEEDEWNGDVLVNAGYAATQLGETERARQHYTRYLEINPGSVDIRVRVAYDLAQGGDLEGALAFVREGLEDNPDDLGLLEQFGSYAFRVAAERQSMAATSQDGDMDPEIAALFREASQTLMRVVEEEGAESNPGYVVNSIRAYLQLNEPQEALRTAERGLEIFPESGRVWSEKGQVHIRLQQTDQAVVALERAQQFNPDLPNMNSRMGSVLAQAGRLDDAMPYFQRGIEAGEQTPDQVANFIFADAHSRGIRDSQDLDYGIRRIELAKNELDVSTAWREQLDFWHGYAIFQRAIQRQAPSTVESARATLPEFRRARELIMAGRPYVQREQIIQNFNEFVGNVDTYIEIQDAIIRRAGR